MSCEIGSNLPGRRSGNCSLDAISRGTNLCKGQLRALSSGGQQGPGGLGGRGTGNQKVNYLKKKNN